MSWSALPTATSGTTDNKTFALAVEGYAEGETSTRQVPHGNTQRVNDPKN